MKESIALIMALCMAISMTACGDSDDSSKSSKKSKDSSSVSQSEESKPADDSKDEIGSSNDTASSEEESSSEPDSDDPSGNTAAVNVNPFGKNLGVPELEEIVNNLKATDYEGGKVYLEAAFKNFLFVPEDGSDLYYELLDNNTLSYYPTKEEESFTTNEMNYTVAFHYNENGDNVPLLFGREVSDIGYGESANGVAFTYGFTQYSKVLGNTGNLYGKDDKFGSMTSIFGDEEYHSYEGISVKEMISADNCYEIVSALMDAYGEPKSTEEGELYLTTAQGTNVEKWKVGDTITKDLLKTITSHYAHLACCWENTPVGKISVWGLFGQNSAGVVLTVEW